jgi:hypothetical protein
MPIANDQMYGGLIQNNGSPSEFDSHDFKASYQNDETETEVKQMFLILWLHAYKYKLQDIVAETSTPHWAKSDFKIKFE